MVKGNVLSIAIISQSSRYGKKTINMAVTMTNYTKKLSNVEDSTANTQLSLDYAIQSLIYTHL